MGHHHVEEPNRTEPTCLHHCPRLIAMTTLSSAMSMSICTPTSMLTPTVYFKLYPTQQRRVRLCNLETHRKSPYRAPRRNYLYKSHTHTKSAKAMKQWYPVTCPIFSGTLSRLDCTPSTRRTHPDVIAHTRDVTGGSRQVQAPPSKKSPWRRLPESIRETGRVCSTPITPLRSRDRIGDAKRFEQTKQDSRGGAFGPTSWTSARLQVESPSVLA